ncbi:MAG: GNAT family N-acetyltransferase [Planctomycetota bacterium]
MAEHPDESGSIGVGDESPVVRRDDWEVVALCPNSPYLKAGYALMRSVFGRETMDSLDSIKRSLVDGQTGILPGFQYVLVQKTMDSNHVLGMLTGDCFWFDEESKIAFIAIGNVATSPGLRSQGVRGMGTMLIDEAVRDVKQQLKAVEVGLLCVCLESEPRARAFWSRRGFVAYEGIDYVQPPLGYHQDGSPSLPVVPETLMLRKDEDYAGRMTYGDVRTLVRHLFQRWYVDGPSVEFDLHADAKRRVESCVQQELYESIFRPCESKGMKSGDVMDPIREPQDGCQRTSQA